MSYKDNARSERQSLAVLRYLPLKARRSRANQRLQRTADAAR